MNKEDILSKYRNENTDEGLENSYLEGRLYGNAVFYALSLLMFFICMFNTKSSDLIWIFWLTATAAEYFAKYRFIKSGKNIRRAVFCCIWALLCVIIYIARTMGWMN